MTRSILRTFAGFAALIACGGRVSAEHDPSAAPDDPGAPKASSGATRDEVPPDDGAPPPSTPSAPPASPSDTCAVSFQRQILPALVRANCTNGGCHGGPTAPAPPELDPTDPVAAHLSLTTYRLADGARYIDRMSCNLEGTCGIQMPLGSTMAISDRVLVDAWLACGAPAY